jgi:hypothetical protein
MPTLSLSPNFSSRRLANSGSVPAVHDTPKATPPRISPFKNRPPWAIRKPTPGVPQPLVESVQQPTAPGDRSTLVSRWSKRAARMRLIEQTRLVFPQVQPINVVKNAPVNYAVRFSGPVTALREKSKVDRPLRLLNSRVTPTPNKSL